MIHLPVIPASFASAWVSLTQKAPFVATAVSGLWSYATAAPRYAASLFNSRVTAPSLGAAGISLLGWTALGYYCRVKYGNYVTKQRFSASEAYGDVKSKIGHMNGVFSGSDGLLEHGRRAVSGLGALGAKKFGKELPNVLSYARQLTVELETAATGLTAGVANLQKMQGWLTGTQKADADSLITAVTNAAAAATKLAGQLRAAANSSEAKATEAFAAYQAALEVIIQFHGYGKTRIESLLTKYEQYLTPDQTDTLVHTTGKRIRWARRAALELENLAKEGISCATTLEQQQENLTDERAITGAPQTILDLRTAVEAANILALRLRRAADEAVPEANKKITEKAYNSLGRLLLRLNGDDKKAGLLTTYQSLLTSPGSSEARKSADVLYHLANQAIFQAKTLEEGTLEELDTWEPVRISAITSRISQARAASERASELAAQLQQQQTSTA